MLSGDWSSDVCSSDLALLLFYLYCRTSGRFYILALTLFKDHSHSSSEKDISSPAPGGIIRVGSVMKRERPVISPFAEKGSALLSLPLRCLYPAGCLQVEPSPLLQPVIQFFRQNGYAHLFRLRNSADRKSTRLNSSHPTTSRMPSSAWRRAHV